MPVHDHKIINIQGTYTWTGKQEIRALRDNFLDFLFTFWWHHGLTFPIYRPCATQKEKEIDEVVYVCTREAPSLRTGHCKFLNLFCSMSSGQFNQAWVHTYAARFISLYIIPATEKQIKRMPGLLLKRN